MPTTEVTATDIQNFLKGETAPDLAKGVALPIAPKDMGISLPVAAEPVEEKLVPKLPADPVFEAGLKTQGAVANLGMQTGGVVFKPEDIALTGQERETFLKAVLLDVPVVFTLTLPGCKELPFTLKTRNNFEQRAMYAALDKDEAEKKIASTMEWLQQLQYYGCAYQLMAIGNKQCTPLSCEATTTMEEARAQLTKYVETQFLPLSVVKWHLIVMALRLFEAKVSAASNELITRDFSKPVG